MKCTFCGRNNDDYLIYCVYCNKALNKAPQNLTNPSDDFIPETEQVPPPIMRTISKVRPVSVHSDLPENQRQPDVPAPVHIPHNRHAPRPGTQPQQIQPQEFTVQAGDDAPHDLPEEAGLEELLDDTYEETKRRRRMTILLVILSVIAVLIFVSYFVLDVVQDRYGSFDRFLTGGQETSEPSSLPAGQYSAISEMVDNDGHAYVDVTVYGNDGEQVTVEPDGQKGTIQNGEAMLRIDTLALLPNDPEEQRETVTQSFTARVVTLQGMHVDVKVPDVEITLEPTTLEAYTRDNNVLTADKNTLEIQGRTQAGAVLRVNNNDISDIITENGDFAYILPVNEYGNIEITVKAYVHGYRMASVVLQASRPEPAIPVSFDGNLPKTTTGPEIHIKGYTDPGCTVTTGFETIEPLRYDAETGTFDFTAQLTRFGRNDVDVTVSKADGTTYTAYYSIQYTPDEGTYTRQAQRMDYNRICINYNNLIGTVFLCEGEVVEVQQTGRETVFKMNTALGGDAVWLRYSGNTAVENGNNYRVFADVEGMQDNIPVLNAQFVYKK